MLVPVLAGLFSLFARTSSYPFDSSELIARHIDNSSEHVLFTADEIHASVLAALPADRITTSHELYDFLQINSAALQQEDKSIYLKDTRAWVTLEATPAENNTIEARQGSCFTSVNRELLYGHAYWAPWHAVSSCHKSDANPGGGYVSVTYEDSVSVSYSAGLAFGGFEGAIGASVGFSVTYGYAESSTYACNVLYRDSVELWARHRHGWAWVKSQSCRICPESSYCSPSTSGYINAASSRSQVENHQWGCSAKSVSFLKGC